MKNTLKGTEPPLLNNYRQIQPGASWEQFTGARRAANRRLETQTQLVRDQGGLCAYCEIRLLQASTGDEIADFRVEHFHPKSDRCSDHNWGLDWNNLLACCHGGSQKNVVDANNRFTQEHAKRSCDVHKGDQDWDELILNPLNLPAYPRLFSFDRVSGAITVDVNNCQQAGIDTNKAQATIDNLRLDSTRLQELRGPVLAKINTQLQGLVQSGLSIEDARQKLAKAILRKNKDNQWPAFFSAIRSYLGSAAEEQLRSLNYSG